ncbi:MAG: hypothetical protein HQ582_23625 [Planctomycetes bacterium]|nr:hypothetical protein [Planctomycetota bacterium]
MGGFRDLLAMLLGWKSAAMGDDPPYRTAAGQIYVTGQRAGQVFTNGPVAGQIHG